LATRTIGPKTISQAQITGERGVAIVKERVHAMGFLFTITGQTEAGIDGFIEIRDAATGRVGGRIIATQVKTTGERRYTAETADRFEYLCDAADVEYWRQSNLPVIIILVRISDRSVYWKVAPDSPNGGDREMRRLRVDKSTDQFEERAADAIANLTVDQGRVGTWLPASRKPDPLLVPAVKSIFPTSIWVADTSYRQRRDALEALFDFTENPPTQWVARGGRLVSFLNLTTSVLRQVIDQGSAEPIATDELAFHEDQDEQNIFVELLNRTLRSQLDPLLVWNRFLKLYYFAPDGPNIDRVLRYMSLKNMVRRAVVKAVRRPDKSVSYVRHSAFRGHFSSDFDDWYLWITPTYVFTRDGVRPDGFAGTRISNVKRLENNPAVRGQFLMWRWLLMQLGQEPAQRSFLDPPIPTQILRFQPLQPLSVPVSVPDELWRERDASAPADDDEELPL
jgi:cell division inhibitor SulA